MGGEAATVRSVRSAGSSRPKKCARLIATTTRVGPAAHVATDEQYQTMRDAGAFDDDVVSGAADAVLFERARVLLVGGATPGEPS